MRFSTKMFLIAAVVIVVICIIAGVTAFIFLPPGTLPLTQSPTTVVSPRQTAAPVSVNGWYRVYFTSPKYPDKDADHHGGLDEKLTAFINTAQSSVDVAIYQLDLANVTQALIDAKKRGASVRVVTDVDDALNDPKENSSFKQLEKADITVVGGNPNSIMHDKFVVVDKVKVWTGSWNFSNSDTYRYNNNAIEISSPELARNYTVTFEKMFNDKKFGPQRKPGGTTPKLTIAGVAVENYFSPEDKVADKIIPRLRAAAKSIDFMAYSFTDDDIGAVVLDRAQAGVQVRGVFETTGSETQYSEYGKMKKAGLDVLQDGNPSLMHHKVFIVDNRTIIFGSFNFTQEAKTDNDENLIMVDDPSLAAQFAAEFARVYDRAKNPPKK